MICAATSHKTNRGKLRNHMDSARPPSTTNYLLHAKLTLCGLRQKHIERGLCAEAV